MNIKILKKSIIKSIKTFKTKKKLIVFRLSHKNQLPYYVTYKITLYYLLREFSHYDVMLTLNINGWFFFCIKGKEDIHTYYSLAVN